MAAPEVATRVSSVHKDLSEFFQCCERLIDSAADLTPFSEEDRKRICFYTNEIAKLTERLSARSKGNRTRVLLVDDESLVRRILKQILASYQDVELVGEAGTGYEAVAAVETLHPDVVVMDIRMPGLDGIAAAREIRDKYPPVKIIGLSEYGNGYNVDAMERAGAVGVYLKSMALDDLYPAIKAAHPTI